MGNLTDHLNQVRDQATQQRKVNHQLRKEKDKLKDQLDGVKQDALQNHRQNQDLEQVLALFKEKYLVKTHFHFWTKTYQD